MRASVQYFLCRGLSVLVSILAVRGVGLQLSASAGVVASTAAGRSTNFGVSVVAAGVAAWAVLGVSEAVGSADAVIKLRDCSASAGDLRELGGRLCEVDHAEPFDTIRQAPS